MRLKVCVLLRVAAGLAFLGVLPHCGPSKPTATDYVGHWEGTYHEYPCHLHISLVGQSLVIKSEDQTFSRCEDYAQVLSMGEDGTAKGGPMGMITLLYDKTTKEIIVNGVPTSRNLRASPMYHEIRERLAGTWTKVPTEGGQMLTDVVIVEQHPDGNFAVREQKARGNSEFRNISYDNGTLRGTFSMVVDSEFRSPFEIKSPDRDTIVYSDERGSETFKRN